MLNSTASATEQRKEKTKASRTYVTRSTASACVDSATDTVASTTPTAYAVLTGANDRTETIDQPIRLHINSFSILTSCCRAEWVAYGIPHHTCRDRDCRKML